VSRGAPGPTRRLLPAACCLLALFTLACRPEQVAERRGSIRRLSIATGGTGGVFYPYGGGIAKVVTAYVPGVEVTAEVTAASVDNLKFLRDGKADIVFTTGDTLADAVNGTDAFEGGPVPVAAMAVLYTNYSQVVALASSTIRDLGDLAGKVVSTGAAGSGTEITAFRLLEASGLDPSADIRKQSLGVSQSVDALKDGKIDAFFWSGGLPTAAIIDLAHTPGIGIRLLPNDGVLRALQTRYGPSLYTRAAIPGGTYAGVDDAVGVVAVAIVLAVHADMPEPLVYDITRALFEHRDELVAIHPEARNLTLESAVSGSAAPFHPGAIRYYQERDVWPP
jgi:hypothetical protein